MMSEYKAVEEKQLHQETETEKKKICRPMVTRDLYSYIPLSVAQVDKLIFVLIALLAVLVSGGIICANLI